MKFDPSPTAIWKKYERDRDYKRSIGLYDRVRRNEAFYLGRQWEGLRVQSLDPLIFNVLRRCVNLFVSMLVSDDVAVRAQPFDMDEDGRQTAHVLERAFASAIERSGVKALGRPLLKTPVWTVMLASTCTLIRLLRPVRRSRAILRWS